MFKERRERARLYLKRAGYADGGPAVANLTFGPAASDKASIDRHNRALQQEYDDGAGSTTRERDAGERATDPSAKAQFDQQLQDTIMKAPDVESEAQRGGTIKKRKR